VELRCLAAEDMATRRITTRPPGNSDVTPEIAAALAGQQNGWETAHRVDISRPLEDSVQEAHAVWRRAIYASGLRRSAGP
jgi:uncharacterized protein